MMKKIALFIFAITMLISNIEKCEARNMNFPSGINENNTGNNNGSPSDEGTSTGCSSKNNCFSGSHTSGDDTYSYEYTKIIRKKTNITVDVYDMEGNSLIPNTKDMTTEYFFKAGTWIGINTTEIHYAEWSVSNFKFYLPYKKYKCHYSKTTESSDYFDVFTTSENACANLGDGVITNMYLGSSKWFCRYEITTSSTSTTSTDIVIEPDADVAKKCKENKPSGYDRSDYKSATYIGVDDSKREDVTNEVRDTIKNTIIDDAVENAYGEAMRAVSYSNAAVNYITANRYPLDTTIDVKTIDQSTSNEITKDTYKATGRETGATSGQIEKQYEILEKNVCMNMKTSEVFYGRTCNESEGEYKIKNGTIYDKNLGKEVKYWHYFIPLNIKSNSIAHSEGNIKNYTEEFENEINANQVFYLSVVKNEKKEFSVDDCKRYMTESNPEHYHYDIVAKGETGDIPFTGNYYNDIIILEQAGSCNVDSKLYFPVTQEFYGETTTGTTKITKLKGFNFYYRPIEINDPFPNGVADNSLWHSWYESTTKTPDISKSFDDDPTYIASNINVAEIREYTKKNPYTSWMNMNLNGTSSYIGTGNNFIIQRKNSGSVYKLGCGPANEKKKLSNGKNNPLYIERCDKS